MEQEVDAKSKEQEEVPESKNERRLEFTLLLLPILAVQNCLRFLELLEFIDFSLLSKRTKFLTSTIHREKVGINLHFGAGTMIYLTLPRHLKTEWLIDFVPEMDRFPNKVFRTINGKPLISLVKEEMGEVKYYYRMIFPEENVIENMKWFAEHLKVVLRSPIKDVSVVDFVNSDIEIFKWLCTLQPNIDFINIDGEQTSSESLLFLFQEFRVQVELSLSFERSDDGFKYNQPINVQALFVKSSRWITMDSIFSSENTMIGINGSRSENTMLCISDSCFTSSDLNHFIKTWMGGRNKKLEFFQTSRIVENYKDGDYGKAFETITEGIEYEPSSEDSERPKFITLTCGKRHDLYQGAYFEIKRNDGRTAAFLQCFIQCTDHIDHHFTFIAW